MKNLSPLGHCCGEANFGLGHETVSFLKAFHLSRPYCGGCPVAGGHHRVVPYRYRFPSQRSGGRPGYERIVLQSL